MVKEQHRLKKKGFIVSKDEIDKIPIKVFENRPIDFEYDDGIKTEENIIEEYSLKDIDEESN